MATSPPSPPAVAETLAAMPVADLLARYEAGLPDKVKKKRGLL